MEAPEIRKREQWGARPPTKKLQKRKDILYIIVHHTASNHLSYKPDESIRGIQEYHQANRGFSDIGYHFVIAPNGEIYEGRPIDTIGAHCNGWNRRSIGIALYGSYDIVPPPKPALEALEKLCGWLKHEYPIRRLWGHRDKGKTVCPGGYLYSRLREIRARIGLK